GTAVDRHVNHDFWIPSCLCQSRSSDAIIDASANSVFRLDVQQSAGERVIECCDDIGAKLRLKGENAARRWFDLEFFEIQPGVVEETIATGVHKQKRMVTRLVCYALGYR